MDHQHMFMVRTSAPLTLNVDGAVRYVADDHLVSVSEPVVLTPTDDRPYKVLEDNHVVIIRNDERYDDTGKKL